MITVIITIDTLIISKYYMAGKLLILPSFYTYRIARGNTF